MSNRSCNWTGGIEDDTLSLLESTDESGRTKLLLYDSWSADYEHYFTSRDREFLQELTASIFPYVGYRFMYQSTSEGLEQVELQGTAVISEISSEVPLKIWGEKNLTLGHYQQFFPRMVIVRDTLRDMS